MSSTAKQDTSRGPVLLLDDDDLYRLELEMHLDSFEYKIWLSTSDPGEALRQLENPDNKELPSIALLDIRLPRQFNGLSLAQKFADLNIPYIYLTAYPDEEQFRKAIRTFPAAYLLKPVSALELHHAIQLGVYTSRHQETVATDDPEDPSHRISNSMISLKNRDNVYQKVHLSEIYAVETYGNFLLFHTQDQRYTLRETLQVMETELAPYEFVRVHRRFLIATPYWEKKLPLLDHIWVAGQKIPTGRGYRKKLRKMIDAG